MLSASFASKGKVAKAEKGSVKESSRECSVASLGAPECWKREHPDRSHSVRTRQVGELSPVHVGEQAWASPVEEHNAIRSPKDVGIERVVVRRLLVDQPFKPHDARRGLRMPIVAVSDHGTA